MKRLFIATGVGLALTLSASAQQAQQPCTRTGNEALDTARCELAVAGQTVAQQSAALIQLNSRVTMLTNDLATAQDQVKKLQEENEKLKGTAKK